MSTASGRCPPRASRASTPTASASSAAGHRDREQPPTVIPTYFSVEGTPTGVQLLVYLPPPNPVWANIDTDPKVVVTGVDDYAYIPTTWRAKVGGPDEDGVPTSYYTAVQLRRRAQIVDDPAGKADLFARQLTHLQPTDEHPDVAAEFKYDDSNPTAHRAQAADLWEVEQRLNDRPRKRLGWCSPAQAMATELAS